jgi:L-lysine exporter family protein LysE/ArgO
MPHSESAVAAGSGLLFGLSLIVAIGAQNTYVLRQGLIRRHLLTVVGICTASDALLIAAGVAGAGAALHQRPWLLQAARLGGAVFLFAYAVLAARRALHPKALPGEQDESASSLPAVILTALALTWLNPAVYLDTVVLLGSVAATHGRSNWWFGGGAAAASALWFTSLGYGARLLIPLFRKPQAWRVLEVLVALVMTTTGLRIVLTG